MAAAALLIVNVINDAGNAAGIQAGGNPPGASAPAAPGTTAAPGASPTAGATVTVPGMPVSGSSPDTGLVRGAGQPRPDTPAGHPSHTATPGPTALPTTPAPTHSISPAPSPTPSSSSAASGTVLADLGKTLTDTGHIVVVVLSSVL